MRKVLNTFLKHIIFVCILMPISGFNPVFSEDSSPTMLKQFLADSHINASPLLSIVKPDIDSQWSQAVLTNDATAETAFGLGLQIGIEKPGYELNSSLLLSNWSNASYTSLFVNYQKSLRISPSESSSNIDLFNKLGLFAGAGLGLGYFANGLTGDSNFGPLVTIFAGQRFDIKSDLGLFYQVSYQHINIATHDTNVLGNTHTVTLNNAAIFTAGIKYFFGERLDATPSTSSRGKSATFKTLEPEVIVKNNYIIQGRWLNSAGKNIDSNANPHYKLRVGDTSGAINIGIKARENAIIYLLDATNNIIAHKSLTKESNELLELDKLHAGEYVIIAGTSEPGVQAPFTLTVSGNVSSLSEMSFIENTISGSVFNNETGNPLANVKVKVFFNAGDIVVFTDKNGRYELPVNLKSLPDAFAMAFSLPGYIPVTRNISQKNGSGFIKNTAMEPESINAVILELEPYLHHLGDGNFRGASNSQFQMAAEGKKFSSSFFINKEHLKASAGKITLQAKGLNLKNKLLLNGIEVTTLDESPKDGSFGDLAYPFDTSLLKEGSNRLEVHSVTEEKVKDFDDFEFTNVILRLEFETEVKNSAQ